MIDKLDHTGDRVVWETPMEMLDDIWLARQQRDTWRKVANAYAIAGDKDSVAYANQLFKQAENQQKEGK